MSKAKKAPRSNVVTYVRLKPEERAQIAEIVAQRGWPHTIASVTAEMVGLGLAAKPKAA